MNNPLRRGKQDEHQQDDDSEDPEEKRRSTRRTAIILCAAAIPVLLGLFVIVMLWSRPDTFGDEMRLDEFFALTNDGRIQEAIVLDHDRRVIGHFDGGPFWVEFGRSETSMSRVLGTLDGAGVPTTFRQQWGKGAVEIVAYILGVLLIVSAFGLVILLVWGRSDSLSGFGKSGAQQLAEGESKITFSDVAGLDEAVEELVEIRDYLSNPERFLAMGASVPKGILLAGPPGCGKTLLARAVAGEAGVPFYSMSGSGFVEMYVGVGASRIRDLFTTAKAHAPCIVFIDELDAVGRGRSASAAMGQDERETTLNQLLVELDGFELATGVVVLAATNRIDVLDPALLRPGRFDRRVTIERPDIKGRRGILAIHGRGKPLAEGVDLEIVARRTAGFSGADLASVVNEAALLSARRGKDQIHQGELTEAIERVLHGPERKTRVLSPRDRQLIAHHEAGHALVSAALPGLDVVHKVSIVSRGHAGGITWFSPDEELMFASRSQLRDRIAVLMAGRAAEELYTGEPSSGAQNDLERATGLARRMVAELGMGEKVGPLSLESPAGNGAYSHMSERISAEVDDEVKRIVLTGLERAHEVLRAHQPVWEALAERLLEEESLEGPDLEVALEPVRNRAAAPPHGVRGPG